MRSKDDNGLVWHGTHRMITTDDLHVMHKANERLAGQYLEAERKIAHARGWMIVFIILFIFSAALNIAVFIPPPQ